MAGLVGLTPRLHSLIFVLAIILVRVRRKGDVADAADVVCVFTRGSRSFFHHRYITSSRLRYDMVFSVGLTAVMLWPLRRRLLQGVPARTKWNN